MSPDIVWRLLGGKVTSTKNCALKVGGLNRPHPSHRDRSVQQISWTSSNHYTYCTYLCCLFANQAFTHKYLMKFTQVLFLGRDCVSPKWKQFLKTNPVSVVFYYFRVLNFFVSIISGHRFWAPTLGQFLSWLFYLHKHLNPSATLWGKYCYPHFTFESQQGQ